MARKQTKTPARGSSARRGNVQRVVIDGTEARRRTVRKTIHLTEEHAYHLNALAAMSSLNGRELTQSGIVEQALEDWFASNEHPATFEVKLPRGGKNGAVS